MTLALESATRAASLVDRALVGRPVDWDREYTAYMDRAVSVFRAMVEGWYGKQLETIFFAERKLERVKMRLTSLLAGYVTRDDNPFTTDSAARLQSLADAIARAP